jgi:uncharacterized protein YggT (Ycf19 family)
MNPLIQYWYFHLPNFVLAAAMYTVLGRILLSFFAPPNWQNYIWLAFKRITDPFVNAVRFITPAAVNDIVLLIFTFLWLMLVRMVLFALLGSQGLLPSAGG